METHPCLVRERSAWAAVAVHGLHSARVRHDSHVAVDAHERVAHRRQPWQAASRNQQQQSASREQPSFVFAACCSLLASCFFRAPIGSKKSDFAPVGHGKVSMIMFHAGQAVIADAVTL